MRDIYLGSFAVLAVPQGLLLGCVCQDEGKPEKKTKKRVCNAVVYLLLVVGDYVIVGVRASALQDTTIISIRVPTYFLPVNSNALFIYQFRQEKPTRFRILPLDDLCGFPP